MKKLLLLICLLSTSSQVLRAQSIAINHFVVKTNPFADDEVAVVATDSLNRVLENVNGVFLFTVNGFEDTLKFNRGSGFYKHKIDQSTFIYLKHINESGSHSKLYYIYKTAIR